MFSSEKVGTVLKGQLDSLGVKVGGEGGIGGIQVDVGRLKVPLLKSQNAVLSH